LKDFGWDARGRGARPGRLSLGLAVAISAAALSACSGTTYGTGKSAEQQLVEDLTGVLSLGPKDKPSIDYSPRPGIVKPPSTEVLPPPQDSVASSANPAWPESPEERLARVRAEATANQNNPLYRPNIIRDVSSDSGQAQALSVDSRTRKAQRDEFLRRRQMAAQGSPTTRRYLSDPPVEYRQPEPTAPADDLGVDEATKERQAKRAASAGTGGLRKLIPWL